MSKVPENLLIMYLLPSDLLIKEGNVFTRRFFPFIAESNLEPVVIETHHTCKTDFFPRENETVHERLPKAFERSFNEKFFCNVKPTATFQNRDNTQIALTRDQCLTTT